VARLLGTKRAHPSLRRYGSPSMHRRPSGPFHLQASTPGIGRPQLQAGPHAKVLRKNTCGACADRVQALNLTRLAPLSVLSWLRCLTVRGVSDLHGALVALERAENAARDPA
jgi:hypothetical protein